MGLHPSLKRAEKLGGMRTVLKRTERIKWLIAKGLWKEGNKVLGLPKIKIVKLKAIKKEKVKEETEEKKPATTENKTT
jgi:small basic protein (TIGR04137 family)